MPKNLILESNKMCNASNALISCVLCKVGAKIQALGATRGAKFSLKS